jgi:deaminated glutathione amidase
MKSYLAAAIQMTSVPDLKKNLSQAEDLIDLAVRRGAEVVGLPENFSFLGDERYQVMILGGGYPVPAGEGKVYNTALLVDKDGNEVARYEKVHLFDVNVPDGNTYLESATVVPGADLPMVYASPEFGNLGLSICYDVRFPELYRHLSRKETDVFFVPAAFTAYTGKDHWQVLLQARAIENTCYMIAPAQTGWHNSIRQSHGHALMIDPWGTVLSDAGTEPGFAIAEISPNRLQQVRRQMPSLQHRVFA